MNINKIILASHGTPGARAAEQLAIDLCLENSATLHHLLVVPDFWKGMMGDDWLNNAITQNNFGDYVEGQLAKEAADELDRFKQACEKAGVSCSSAVKLGKPAECLTSAFNRDDVDLVVIGSPRPKRSPGYRSRMDLEQLTRSLTIPLIIAPHPEK